MRANPDPNATTSTTRLVQSENALPERNQNTTWATTMATRPKPTISVAARAEISGQARPISASTTSTAPMTVARFIHERGADLPLVGGFMSSAPVASYSLVVKATRALPDDADAFEDRFGSAADAFETASEALDRVLKLLDTES